MFQQLPAPVCKKIVFTFLIGLGCAILGFTLYISTADRTLLFLSMLIMLCCSVKALSLYLRTRKNKYEMVEGTCVHVTQKMFGKFKTIKIMDGDGLESTLCISKNCKLKIGDKYRLYFSQQEQIRTGNNYFDTVLMTDNFLGVEYVADTPKDTAF